MSICQQEVRARCKQISCLCINKNIKNSKTDDTITNQSLSHLMLLGKVNLLRGRERLT